MLPQSHINQLSSEVHAIVSEIESEKVGGRKQGVIDRLVQFRRLIEVGGIQTLEPLLPLCLSLQGSPYELSDHFPFSPLFKTSMSKNTLVKAGRQVSKSTSMAAHGVMLSNAIPFLRSLYITPLYESIRRFSNNYVRPFINNSPIKELWSGTSTENSVLQRTFKNSSMMQFSFALLDCDRIRGISSDFLNIDESFCGLTSVCTPTGTKFINQVKPGDVVKCFAENGEVRWTTVRKQWYAGRRHCYRVTLEDGTYVDSTAESYVSTNSGCFRMDELIKIVAAARNRKETTSYETEEDPILTNTVDNDQRDVTGRRISDTEWSLRRHTMLCPEGVSLGKVHDLVRLRIWETVAAMDEESQVLIGDFQDCCNTGIKVPTATMVPGWHQTDYDRDARQSGQFSVRTTDDVVDLRRRDEMGAETFPNTDALYERLPIRRGRSFMPMADGSRLSILDIGDQAGQPARNISGDLFSNECGREVNGTAPTNYPPSFSLQGECYWEERLGDLYILQSTIPVINAAQADGSHTEAVLQQRRVQLLETSGRVRTLHGFAGEERSEEPQETTKICNRYGITQKDSYCERIVERKESRENESLQHTIRAKTTGNKGRSNASLLTLQTETESQTLGPYRQNCLQKLSPAASTIVGKAEVLSRKRKEREVRSGTSECQGTDHKTECVTYKKIVSIEYSGLRDVFDVETTEPHTVVLNGHARPQCQDFDPSHLGVVREVLSHSDFSVTRMTGTPKTIENLIEGQWRRSSQAEWIIPCYSCGTWNIPSMEYHIYDMIGPLHNEISEQRPGTICHAKRCRRPIFPRHGHWVHRYPERRWKLAGYHVPQIIMPLHYARREKWAELLAKQAGWGNTTPAMFCNEVLGESVDAGQKLITTTQLIQASSLPWRNNSNSPSPAMIKALDNYEMRVLSVDWGGGGEDGVSFTTLALLGVTSSGQIHCLWGKRLVASQDHLREASECLHWLKAFRCSLLAHDYTGAGTVRETVLVQAGFDLNRVMAIEYCRAAANSLMRYIEATVNHNRARYRLDKTRSLLYTCQAIKLQLVRFFEYDYVNDDDPGLIHDFLALVENKSESRLAGDIYSITRNIMLTDDFAQAVNIGCCAIWHANGSWPNFAEAASIGRITASQIMAAGSADYGWDQDRTAGFYQMP